MVGIFLIWTWVKFNITSTIWRIQNILPITCSILESWKQIFVLSRLVNITATAGIKYLIMFSNCCLANGWKYLTFFFWGGELMLSVLSGDMTCLEKLGGATLLAN